MIPIPRLTEPITGLSGCFGCRHAVRLDDPIRCEEVAMHSIFYIIGVIVVVLAVLSLLGLA